MKVLLMKVDLQLWLVDVRNDGNANFVEKGNIAGFLGSRTNFQYIYFQINFSVDYFLFKSKKWINH